MPIVSVIICLLKMEMWGKNNIEHIKGEHLQTHYKKNTLKTFESGRQPRGSG